MDAVIVIGVVAAVCWGIARGIGWVRMTPDERSVQRHRQPSWREEFGDREIITLAVIAALLVPPLGFLMAIGLFLRSQVGPGMAVLLLCLVGIPVSIVFWGAVLSS